MVTCTVSSPTAWPPKVATRLISPGSAVSPAEGTKAVEVRPIWVIRTALVPVFGGLTSLAKPASVIFRRMRGLLSDQLKAAEGRGVGGCQCADGGVGLHALGKGEMRAHRLGPGDFADDVLDEHRRGGLAILVGDGHHRFEGVRRAPGLQLPPLADQHRADRKSVV